MLPAAYTYINADNGNHTFQMTMNTAGTQTIHFTDDANVPGAFVVAVDSGPGSLTNPNTSCATILQLNPTAASGSYELLDNSNNIYSAYCDMTTAGGGWTLALKADGANSTWNYYNALWTNADTYQADQYTLDTQETKLASFNSITAAEVLVKMAQEGPATSSINGLTLPLSSPQTLNSLFSSNSYAETTAVSLSDPTITGRDAWMSMFSPNAQMQPYCNQQGFNVLGQVGSRIGLITNDQNDCSSPDSHLGIGGTGQGCAPGDTGESVGDLCGCSCVDIDGNPAAGNDIAAFGWVLIR